MQESFIIDQPIMPKESLEGWLLEQLESFEERMQYGNFDIAYGSLIVIQQLLICVPITQYHDEIWTHFKKSVLALEAMSKEISWWRKDARKLAQAGVTLLKHVGLGTFRKMEMEKSNGATTIDAWNARWQEFDTDDRQMADEMKRVWG